MRLSTFQTRVSQAVFIPAAVLSLALASAPVHAQTDTQGRSGWVVVPVTSEAKRMPEAQSLAARLEGSLRGAGVDLVQAAQARERFEAVHSKPPVVLEADALQALRKQVQKATHHLAMRELQDALEATKQLRSLGVQAQDYLRRELARARELFDICVMTASQMAAGGQKEQARSHMLRCVQSYPGLAPELDLHAPDVHELYEDVVQSMDENRAATLVVRSAGSQSCTTRVNGISWGPAPAQIETTPATVRVQLECGDQPGRVHTITLEPGHNEVSIDPVFDSALRSKPPRLALLYEHAAQMRDRRVQDALTVTRSVNASHVVTVEAGETVTIRHLRASGKMLDELSWRGPLDDTHELSRITEALASEQAPADAASQPPSTATSSEAAYTPALPVLELGSAATWLVPTTMAVGYALSVSATAYALHDRAARRQDALGSTDFELVDYNRVGALGLGLTAAGSALASTAELLGLPDQPGIPWWAWAAGAGAVAVTGTAIVSWAALESCEIGDDHLRCTRWHRDPLLGPLLLMHSAPLWAIPLTYVLSEALETDASASLHFDGRAARMVVRGRF